SIGTFRERIVREQVELMILWLLVGRVVLAVEKIVGARQREERGELVARAYFDVVECDVLARVPGHENRMRQVQEGLEIAKGIGTSNRGHTLTRCPRKIVAVDHIR